MRNFSASAKEDDRLRLAYVRDLGRRGFALGYALLVSVVIVSFFAALTLAYRGTVQANRFSEASVRAQSLADLGNTFVYQLFLEHGPDFIPLSSLPFIFSNDPSSPHFLQGVTDDAERTRLAAALAPEVLGGTFEVTVSDATTQGVQTTGSGTYWTTICKAQVGDYTTTLDQSSRFLVKIGTPFVNYLHVARGDLRLYSNAIRRGPVFAGGRNAAISIQTRVITLSRMTGLPVALPVTPNLSGNYETSGPFRLITSDLVAGSTNVDSTLPKNSYPPGTLVPDIWGAGGFQVVDEVHLNPYSSLVLKHHSINEVLDELQQFGTSHPSLVDTLDITDAGIDSSVGILVEVDDQVVNLYEARRRSIGKLYDLALMMSIFEPKPPGVQEPDKGRMLTLYGSRQAGVEAGVWECEWDDPAYPNENYPANLLADVQTFLSNEGVSLPLPASGDYIEIHEVVAGRHIASYTLPTGGWKNLRLVANRVTSPSKDDSNTGALVYPPVFLRGRVDGKLFLSYDSEEPDGDRQDCSIYVLGTTPDTPGGLTLKDPGGVILDPTTEAPGGDDMVLLMAGGQVSSNSLPAFYLQRMWSENTPSGSWRNLLAETLNLPGVSPDKLKEETPSPNCPLYAATVADFDDRKDTGVTSDLRRVIDSARTTTSGISWGGAHVDWAMLSSESGNSAHPSLSGTPLVPRRMRSAFLEADHSYQLVGARCSLGSGVGLAAGTLDYDYRWRNLSATDLSEVLGLPIGPILIDKRGM